MHPPATSVATEASTLALDEAAPAQQAPGLLGSLPMMVAILAIFYFLLIRPQQKEAKAHRELIAGLKKGDDVVTASGLYGRIHEVKEHVVIIEVADKVRLQFDKSAVKVKAGGAAAGGGN